MSIRTCPQCGRLSFEEDLQRREWRCTVRTCNYQEPLVQILISLPCYQRYCGDCTHTLIWTLTRPPAGRCELFRADLVQQLRAAGCR